MADMGSVGLLYVGAVLVINGLMLLGRVDARAAAPLNFFVGGLQVITPTYLIFTSGGDADTILGASGLYLFGFTYLYVGLNLLAGLAGTGPGGFSLSGSPSLSVGSICWPAWTGPGSGGSPRSWRRAPSCTPASTSAASTIRPSGSSGCTGRCCGRCSSSCSA